MDKISSWLSEFEEEGGDGVADASSNPSRAKNFTTEIITEIITECLGVRLAILN